MLKIGDTVRVISPAKYKNGDEEELIKIGTICTVVEVCNENEDGTGDVWYGITDSDKRNPFYYVEKELEKGHLEWVKDEK